MVGSLAQRWAQRESFVGNVIRWTEVIEWLTATPGVPVTTRAAGRLRGNWEERAAPPASSKQTTLQDMGVTGGHQTVGSGGKARTDKARARCRDLPEVRGPVVMKEEDEEGACWLGIQKRRWRGSQQRETEAGRRQKMRAQSPR